MASNPASGSSGGMAPRPVSPALPAALALKRAGDGSGDVFSLRVGSPASALVMGATPVELLRQHLGLGTASASGRDPGGFPTDLSRGLLSPFSLPGTLMEVMSGVALALDLRGEARVALLVDDTQGTGSGDWHEGLNFAAVRRVPMVLVVDDATSRPVHAAADSMAARAEAYGFRAHVAEGSDPLALHHTVREAVEEARTGEGLQVVEVNRPRGSPPDLLAERLVAEGALAARDPAEMRRAAEAEMARTLAMVQAESPPPPEAVLAGAGPGDGGSPSLRTPRSWR